MRPFVPFLLAAAGGGAALAQQFVAERPPSMQWLTVLHVGRGDIDGDADQDLYLRLWSTGLRWSAILHNDGSGRFTDLGNTLVQIGEQTAAFVDFDGDGDDDLFVSLVGRGQLLRRVGNGFVDASALLPLSPAWHEMIVGDLDGDGDLDLAGVGNVLIMGRNHVLRNDGSSGFRAIDPFPGQNGRIRAGDVDGDGDLDVLLGPAQSGGPPVLWRNDGGMVFTDVSAGWLPAGLPAVNTFEFGDVDGDGDLDLVLGSGAGGDLLLRNVGGRFVAVPGALPPNGSTTFFPRFGDVDEDGDLDLWRGETGATATTHLLLNDGTGWFTAAPLRLPAGGVTETIRQCADLDGDGDLDAVVSGAGGATILWNRHRQVGSPAQPVRGAPWTVELSSQPGYGTTLRGGLLAFGVARLPQRLGLPPFGTLWLDVSAEIVLAPAMFAPGSGPAVFTFPVPALPALAGMPLHLQGLVEDAPGRSRLTSVQTVVIQ